MWPLPSAAVVLIAAALVAAPRPAPPAGAAVDLLVDTVADPGAGGAVDGDEVEDCTDGIADGDCSLREALRYANADPALDRIGFGVPGGGVQTIAPAAALPAIADDGVTVDGYTQPGARPNTRAAGTDAAVLVELRGSGTGAFDGLTVTGADVTVRGLAVGGFYNGVVVRGPRAAVEGCYIGTDAGGAGRLRNTQSGVVVNGGADARVGTNGDGLADAAERNVVSGNGDYGVLVKGSGAARAVVAGNYIGVDAGGTAPLGNGGDGVEVRDAADARVGTDGDGTADAAERNVVSANGRSGVVVKGSGAARAVVAGNYVGLDADGAAPLGNSSDGVQIEDVPGALAGTNGDGLADAAERNAVSGNGDDGIKVRGAGATGAVVAGNYVGTDATGTRAIGNGDDGVFVTGAPGALIGTDGDGLADEDERNVASGNGGDGVYLSGSGAAAAVVAGNYVGTDAAGATDLGNSGHGVHIRDAPGARVGTDGNGVADAAERNVVSSNGRSGIYVLGSGAKAAVVAGNYVGTDAAGVGDLGNREHGVYVRDAPGAVVGTDGDGVADAAERNVVSGNDRIGVYVEQPRAAGAVVAGNYVGVDAGGAAALPNSSKGVEINDAPGVRVGTNGDGLADAAERNVVSGNGDDGIRINGSSAGAVVAGNYVGTNAAGTAPLGNKRSAVSLSARTRVGTNGDGVADVAERNVLSGNGDWGVRADYQSGAVVAGNFIGTDAAGTAPLGNGRGGVYLDRSGHVTVGGAAPGAGNRIAWTDGHGVRVERSTTAAVLGNTFHDNAGLGIDLRGGAETGGVTANDAGDADGGPNGLQNFPVITSAVDAVEGVDVAFTLDSTPSTAFRVELFASAAADPSGHGEGARFLAAVGVTTDETGGAAGAVSVAGVEAGEVVAVTATPLDGASPTGFGGTSEFSAAVAVRPTAAFATTEVAAVEGGAAALVVALSAPAPPGGATVEVALDPDRSTGSAADLGGATSWTARFAPGDAEARVTIDVTDDGQAEPAETFAFRLQSASGAALGAPAEARLTVAPSRPSAAFTATQQVAREGDGAFALRIALSEPVDEPATVVVRLVSGDPADLGGFTEATLAVDPGRRLRELSVDVPLTDDAAPEPEEPFVFRLEASGGLAAGPPTLTSLVVIDDDARVAVTAPPRDADGDGVEDGGRRLLAVPVAGLTAGALAEAAGGPVYRLGLAGAFVEAPADAVLAAGSAVLVDVAAGAVLTLGGAAPGPATPPAVPVDVDGDGTADRLLVAVGAPLPLPLADVDAGGALADVALVFDGGSGSLRPVFLGGLGGGVLDPLGGAVLQVTPGAAPNDGVDGPRVGLAGAPLFAAGDEDHVVLALHGGGGAVATFVLRVGVGGAGLDPFDGLAVTVPGAATLAGRGPGGLPYAALAVGDLAGGAAVVPLAVAVPTPGDYEIVVVGAQPRRSLAVEVADGRGGAGAAAAFTATADEAGRADAFEGRFALRVAVRQAVDATSAPPVGPALVAFPNPAAGTVSVRLSRPPAEAVRVAVYDALGREVARLHDGPAAAGGLRLAFDAGRLPPGAYVVRARGGAFAEAARITVVR